MEDKKHSQFKTYPSDLKEFKKLGIDKGLDRADTFRLVMQHYLATKGEN